ncbi:hypothetical protein KO507_01325 [Gilvimarinus agarilyticus]|uniref:hypothetical protein n=1 Tax=unclassified Gilvimarinus TaxID=2642066 RepID=UPI001C08EE4A|nr:MULTISPECIES: hypothetical protein [unclassified Gilvimarinus]MBU2884399.1 hypothetical protein [Gilvimarinus agarilyticus]MDO6569535.1 hypothetical protein [Gilvimarinus sp. 2_MG-2023]MDO6748139.1 hypothetical protein [Gilvimarinus sp. 1_MG-2023]
MYIWKTAALSKDIKNHNVNQNEWRKYYLAASIFVTIAIYLTALTPHASLMAVLIEAIVMIGILIFGVSFTYHSNKGDDGTDYIARMTALALPISVKAFVISLAFGVIIGVLSQALSISASSFDWLMLVFGSIIQVCIFWRLNEHIKFINA